MYTHIHILAFGWARSSHAPAPKPRCYVPEGVRCTGPCVRPICLQRLSLLRFVDPKLPGKSLWT